MRPFEWKIDMHLQVGDYGSKQIINSVILAVVIVAS